MDPALARALCGSIAGTLGGVAASRPTLVDWPGPVRPAVGAVVGTAAGVTGAVLGGALAGQPPRPSRPSPRALAATAGVVVAAGIGISRLRRRAVTQMLAAGRDLEHAFTDPPEMPTVSGGAGSLVPYLSVGREGARFVSLPSSADAIERVSGRPASAEPIRAFVGYDAAGSAEDRVALAMAELERTGAFDRGTLIVQAPAGTGFANSTPVEVVELLTGGDCAVVAVGYGLLPSFLSLDRVPLAARTQRLLLEAVARRWEAQPAERRPAIVLYGESLGAKVQQAALPAGIEDLDRFHVSAALWVGTPGGATADAFHDAVSSIAVTVDRPDQIAGVLREPYPRVWFLEHDGDPVVRFRPALLARRPAWLSGHPRGRNIPEGMVWLPGLTWLTTLVDTLFATNVKPGDFQSRGHDYREDLGAVVTAAYRLPADSEIAQRLEVELRRAEVDRARLIEAAEG